MLSISRSQAVYTGAILNSDKEIRKHHSIIFKLEETKAPVIQIREVLEIALQCTEMNWQRKMHINISPASVEIHVIPAHRRPARSQNSFMQNCTKISDLGHAKMYNWKSDGR